MIPKVSVIMPVYNAEAYLEKSISCILTQTFKDFEFLIMNDGSTDQSLQIIKDFAQKDHRIRFFSQKNSGIVASLNDLIAQSKTDFIARMDADDFYYPERLQLQYEHLQKHPDSVLLGGLCRIILDGKPVGITKGFTEDFMNRWFLTINSPFVHSSVMIKKSALQKAGLYRKDYYPTEDYDLWIRLKNEGKIENIGEIIGEYSIVSSSITSQNFQKQIAKRLQLNSVNFEDLYQKKQIPIIQQIISFTNTAKLAPEIYTTLGRLCCLTGCFLMQKKQINQAKNFFKLGIKYDKKSIDSLLNLITLPFGKSFYISGNHKPGKKIPSLKLHIFKTQPSK